MKYYKIGAVLLGLVAGTVHGDPVQWSVADGGNGHWYEGFAEIEEITFEEATAYAVAKGGYLASITSEGESNFVKNNVANDSDLWVYDVNGCFCGGPFIGGYRDSEDDWHWIDGSNWKWTSWHSGNPDGAPEDSQSVRLWDFSIKNWVDHRNAGEEGSVVISYIVEWTSLPLQWRIEDGGNGHWYQGVLAPSGITWLDANEAAIGMGGYLVSITSEDEGQWIREQVSSNPELWTEGWGTQNAGPYIGARHDGDSWSWTTTETWSYTNWHSGNPNNTPNAVVVLFDLDGSDGGYGWQDVNYPPGPDWIISYIVEFTTYPGSALGACCLDGLCITTVASDCNGNSGSWGGQDSSCTDFDCPVNCPGDVNGDENVDITDLLMLIAAWGACP